MWQVRILVSLFPLWLLGLYKKLLAPLGGGQVAAVIIGAYVNIFIRHDGDFLCAFVWKV